VAFFEGGVNQFFIGVKGLFFVHVFKGKFAKQEILFWPFVVLL